MLLCFWYQFLRSCMKFYQYVWKFVYSPLHQNSVVLSCYIFLKKYIYCQYELFFSFITFDFHFFFHITIFALSFQHFMMYLFHHLLFHFFLCYFILRLFLVKQNKADFFIYASVFPFFESCINLPYLMLLTFLNLFMACFIFPVYRDFSFLLFTSCLLCWLSFVPLNLPLGNWN